jgi:DNA-binding HxlR family transcriptional regulator
LTDKAKVIWSFSVTTDIALSFAHKIYKLYFMDINHLVKITARAWCLTILARLHQGVPGRQAALLAETGAGRTAFGQSLGHLIALGVLERNPGHGHPLRPEYRLTPIGTEAARIADQIERATPQTAETTLLRRAWTVPVLAVSGQPRSFTQIKSTLPEVTDRALSQSLKNLQEHAWIARDVKDDSHPPRASYQAVGTGLDISRAIDLNAASARL